MRPQDLTRRLRQVWFWGQLGKTLKQWRDAFSGYFDTGGANNGGTEETNGPVRAPPTRRPRVPLHPLARSSRSGSPQQLCYTN